KDVISILRRFQKLRPDNLRFLQIEIDGRSLHGAGRINVQSRQLVLPRRAGEVVLETKFDGRVIGPKIAHTGNRPARIARQPRAIIGGAHEPGTHEITSANQKRERLEKTISKLTATASQERERLESERNATGESGSDNGEPGA